MGVYVKGVEKPRSCGECFIGRRFMCEHVETFEDCPMVEVAEPHGRLIDADDLTPDEVAVDEMTFLAVEWDEIKAAPTVIEADEHRQLAEWLQELKRLRESATDTDTISRQAAIDVASGYCHPANIADELRKLPSAQPERTCVNCGRTANNGGWYADGRTRCPIEEHYALPKDGYCHLWEKRNITDDDYPERRE